MWTNSKLWQDSRESKGIYRESHVHVLNQKEVAMRAAKELGKKYEETNLIVCHVGGGLSITAQKHGKIVDGNDVLNGDGPMAPNRSGYVPLMHLSKNVLFRKIHITADERKNLQKGGLISLLGTDDMRIIDKRLKRETNGHLLYSITLHISSENTLAPMPVIKWSGRRNRHDRWMLKDEMFIEKVKEHTGLDRTDDRIRRRFRDGSFSIRRSPCIKWRGRVKKNITGVPVWSGFDFEPGDNID